MPRKTIREAVALEGIGLHRGTPSRVRFLPAAGPTGLRFLGPGFPAPVPARLESVSGTARGTNISDGKNVIYTVEHLLSAASALGIDDLDIELSGEEPPAMDGSALPFAQALLKAGFAELPGTPDIRRPAAPLELNCGQTRFRLSPAAEGLTVALVYDYPHKLVGRQAVEVRITPETYLAEVAPARTFGFSHELEALKAAGLARGGSLDNAMVIAENEVLAKGGLRFPDEFARHKVLDLLGDLALAGFRLDGARLEAERSGHAGNVNFAKLLVQNLPEAP
jgi:UDP-3-O-acyl N-acetylglucosamine deacetylase